MQVFYQCTLLTRSSRWNIINVMDQHGGLVRETQAKAPGRRLWHCWRADTPPPQGQTVVKVLLALPTESKPVCWSLRTGTEKKHIHRLNSYIPGVSNVLICSMMKPALEKQLRMGATIWLSLFHCHSPGPIFFSDPSGKLKKGIVRITTPASFKCLMLAPVSAVLPAMQYYFVYYFHGSRQC